MDKDEILKIELPSLRDELLEVKKCQHHLFIFELISTGAIVGFLLPCIATLLKEIHFWPILFFLSPLVIIVPSQYLILDKAITVNRICSYFKIIEKRIAYKTPIKDEFFAWENGCAEFRKNIFKLAPSQTIPNPTQGPNHFYKLMFIIMAIISAGLLSLMTIFYFTHTSIEEINSAEIAIMAVLIVSTIVALAHQYAKLKEVLEGRYTILAMASLWNEIV